MYEEEDYSDTEDLVPDEYASDDDDLIESMEYDPSRNWQQELKYDYILYCKKIGFQVEFYEYQSYFDRLHVLKRWDPDATVMISRVLILETSMKLYRTQTSFNVTLLKIQKKLQTINGLKLL